MCVTKTRNKFFYIKQFHTIYNKDPSSTPWKFLFRYKNTLKKRK